MVFGVANQFETVLHAELQSLGLWCLASIILNADRALAGARCSGRDHAPARRVGRASVIFKQFYLESLGHASYLVGDERTGEALVLDPRRDVDVYFDEARAHGMRLAYAVDTHGHNDYVTGVREIAARERVEVLGYADADLRYDHRDVRDGEVLELGDTAFEVLHTPGHTPEHMSLLVYDRAAGDEPTLMLSGGALLVGDLARPDLLGGEDEARRAATEFCRTIQERILWRLPDHLEVWPTHVAGSLCGGNIGSRLSTTVGYER
jgi:hydroxyacylglutathione hydrolase